jgi:hypothetical protein
MSSPNEALPMVDRPNDHAEQPDSPPKEDDIASLPRLAQIALGIRCVYRLLPLAPSGSQIGGLCRKIVGLIEKLTSACEIGTEEYDSLRSPLESEYRKLGSTWRRQRDNSGNALVQSAFRICEAALDDLYDEYYTRDGHSKIWQAVAYAWDEYHEMTPDSSDDGGRSVVWNDLLLLRGLAKKHGWNDDSFVSQDVFPLHSRFPLHVEDPSRSVLCLTRPDEVFIRRLLAEPQLLYGLPPRAFEELVAEVLNGLGYEVNLTAQTRDGGVDIIAVENRIARARYLIECKRFAAERRVGIAAAQRLYGVVTGTEATIGILVTTSSLSRDARCFVDQHPWRLGAREYDGLLEWLKSYDRMKIERALVR